MNNENEELNLEETIPIAVEIHHNILEENSITSYNLGTTIDREFTISPNIQPIYIQNAVEINVADSFISIIHKNMYNEKKIVLASCFNLTLSSIYIVIHFPSGLILTIIYNRFMYIYSPEKNSKTFKYIFLFFFILLILIFKIISNLIIIFNNYYNTLNTIVFILNSISLITDLFIFSLI
tara:strand:- start:164 stop:703 length:540 start_codon:yes stop_codon:yes gene_type:complete